MNFTTSSNLGAVSPEFLVCGLLPNKSRGNDGNGSSGGHYDGDGVYSSVNGGGDAGSCSSNGVVAALVVVFA